MALCQGEPPTCITNLSTCSFERALLWVLEGKAKGAVPPPPPTGHPTPPGLGEAEQQRQKPGGSSSVGEGEGEESVYLATFLLESRLLGLWKEQQEKSSQEN